MIIDSHFHLGYSPGFYFHDITIGTCLETMDLLGISHVINTHMIGLTCGDINRGMDEDRKAFELSEGRILSYFVYNPTRGRECIDVMERNFDIDIFKGIKIHPSFHGVYADDPSYEMVWEYASDKKLPIMSHTWGMSSTNPTQKFSFPSRFENYIRKFPGVNFICGHSGGRYDGVIQCARLAGRYANVCLDLSGDVYYNRLVEYLVKEAGSDRVLYGSDGFWIDWRTQLGMVLGADISNRDRENILYRNAAKLFGIVK